MRCGRNNFAALSCENRCLRGRRVFYRMRTKGSCAGTSPNPLPDIRTILRARPPTFFFIAARTNDRRFCTSLAGNLQCSRVSAVRTDAVRLRRLQMLINRDALIEHKAFSFKGPFRALLQIRENAAFELKNILIALFLHRDDGLLAADTASAVEKDLFVLRNV